MRTFILTALAALIPLSTSAADDLLARMAAVNSGLHSYTATMKAHVALTTFPFLTADIGATMYHKDPDLNKLEVTSGLPSMASQFSKLYPRIEPPSRWPDMFTIKTLSDDGKVTTLQLTPKVTGNVDSMVATVDDSSALLRSMKWNYAGGASAQMDNTYSQEHGYWLITAQTGSVNEPSYKGTVSSTISSYKINPPLDDAIFKQ
jgi:outer membrane lipoprotein-sorting protein